jgi:hypothetical protein
MEPNLKADMLGNDDELPDDLFDFDFSGDGDDLTLRYPWRVLSATVGEVVVDCGYTEAEPPRRKTSKPRQRCL